MNKLPQIANITDLRNSHLAVLAKLEKGPVVINSRSQPVGVLVSPKLWDRLVEYIDDLEDSLDAVKMELAIAKGEVEMMTQDEIKEWLTEDEIVEGERVPA
jgi:prevent-host-death family protein